MTPNDLYKTNPNSEKWSLLTMACGNEVDTVEIGKYYFVTYANAGVDDNYPLIFPYSMNKDTILAVNLHVVPMNQYEKIKRFAGIFNALFDKKSTDRETLVKSVANQTKNCTRRYFPRLFKKIVHISDIDKAYALWLNLAEP